MNTPCLDCGRPSPRSRCDPCHAEHTRARNAKQYAIRRSRGGRPGYGSDYRRRAAAVRANATTCWLCGQGPRPDDPFQADHSIPIAQGGAASPLLPAHRSCNIARSNASRSAAHTTTTRSVPNRSNRTGGAGGRVPLRRTSGGGPEQTRRDERATAPGRDDTTGTRSTDDANPRASTTDQPDDSRDPLREQQRTDQTTRTDDGETTTYADSPDSGQHGRRTSTPTDPDPAPPAGTGGVEPRTGSELRRSSG